ncbi:ubiquitin carboxyl-terminal hydrolase 9-like [Phragmites australis]|uniref:ubiquitin carboxyl-terminal hydrolase 9-like n=1 Tax=Phragmites australis TaxID=29695 RepID=UPI002D77FB92|nr:ubiquitin carboxyl-terminal hydrolase 9-like [Phragmites australis]
MTIPSAEGFLAAASCLPCTAEEERETVSALMREAEENVKDGDLRYLVDQSWWMNWQRYVGLISDVENGTEKLLEATNRPGEIDNSKLVLEETISSNEEPQLQRTLREGQDYTLVPHEVWRRLYEWYKGGPELPRKVILDNPASKSYLVDVYPLSLKLIDERDSSEKIIRISRKAKVHELYRMVCSLMSVEQSKINIWDYFNKEKSKKLTNLEETLEEAQLFMDQEILLEVKADDSCSDFSTRSTNNELALIPLEPSTSSFSIAGGPTFSNGYSFGIGSSFLQDNSFNPLLRDTEEGYSSFNNGTKEDIHGLSGLNNLGNTCFMNSAIQSLVHTPPLVEYFLGDYTTEINTENPLGLQGELAIAFGELLRKLWSAGQTSVAPRAFKSKLSRFAPQFSGYNQHDSQELLAFLLDGLHEDLNRVKKKPYIEAKDADGRPDEEFAEECWSYHKARNDSIIVDKFQGQYKSTLVCPVCNKISVTFDPFMYLSLPLPSTVTRMMTVTVFSGTGDALPMPYTVTIQKNGTCKDLAKALTDVCCLKSSETLLLAEVYEHRIYRYLTNPLETLYNIKDEDLLVAYKLPVGHEKLLRLEILHRKGDRFGAETQFNISRKLIGSPLVTCIPIDSTRKSDIYAAVSAVLAPFVRAKVHGSDESVVKLNGYGPRLDGMVLTDNGNSCEEGLSTSDANEKAADDELLPFQLSLTDDKGITRNAINTDSNRVLGLVMRLSMDWSDREHEIYNIDYMDELPDVFKHGFLSKKTRQEAINFFSCLDAFLKEEPLGPDDMWYCPGCKEHRQASKKLDLWRLPEILVVHLKRFSYSRYMKNKLDTFVNFPIHDLNMSKYVKQTSTSDQRPMYELYAVINHYGGLGGGHYSAYAKLVEEDNWYHFDDSHVSSVNEDEIRTSAAYVLFYRRVGGSSTVVKDGPVDIDMVDSLET